MPTPPKLVVFFPVVLRGDLCHLGPQAPTAKRKQNKCASWIQ